MEDIESRSSCNVKTACTGLQSRQSVTCLLTLAFDKAEEELRQNLSDMEYDDRSPPTRSSPLMVDDEDDDGSIESELRGLEDLENSVREELREYEEVVFRTHQEELLQEELLQQEEARINTLPCQIISSELQPETLVEIQPTVEVRRACSPLMKTTCKLNVVVPESPTASFDSSAQMDDPRFEETRFVVGLSPILDSETRWKKERVASESPISQPNHEMHAPGRAASTNASSQPKTPSSVDAVAPSGDGTPSSQVLDGVNLFKPEAGRGTDRSPGPVCSQFTVEDIDEVLPHNRRIFPIRCIFHSNERYDVSPIDSDESESFGLEDAPLEGKLKITMTESTVSETSEAETEQSDSVEPVSVIHITSDPLPTQGFEDMMSAAYVQSGHGGMSLALASDMLAAQLNSNPGSILQQWLGRKFREDISNKPLSPHWLLGVPVLGSASGTDDVLLMANTLS